MEGASEHPMQSTSEFSHTVGDQPYSGLVYVGRRPQGHRPRLLPDCRSSLPRVESIGKDQNTSARGIQIGRLVNKGATHRPGERGRLRAQPLHKYICVGGHPGRAHWSGTYNYQASVRKERRPTADKTTTTTIATTNSSGSSKCHTNSSTYG